MLKFLEITGGDEGLIKMKNRIDERLLAYDLFTHITSDSSGNLCNKTHKYIILIYRNVRKW